MSYLKEIITIMEIYYTKSTLKYILIKKRSYIQVLQKIEK